MSYHARLAASSAHRWLICAGSVALGEGKNTTSQYAAAGTFAHDIAAKCLADQTLRPTDFLLKKGTVDGFEIICDQEMIEAIQVYLDACDEDLENGDVTWIEMSLHEELKKIDRDCGGTGDYVRYRPATKHLHVIDFKFGSGTYVEATDNKQMKKYALGALLEVLRLGHLVERIKVTICQPRFEGAAPLRSEEFKAVELMDFAVDIQEAAAKTRLPNPPLVAGEHCKFCPAARTCPELEKRQHALIAADFGPVAQYDVAALATALGQVSLVKERIKAIEEFAYAEANRGIEIPGYKLVAKIAHRQWKSEGDVIEWAQKAGIDPYEPRSVLSPKKIEDKLKEAAPKGKKKAAGEVLEKFVQRISSGNALVPIADNRAPVKLVEAKDFPALN